MMNAEVNPVTVTTYKEETWGKEYEGEYIIDGYKYIGKTALKKALDALKEKKEKRRKR